jgi:hypothetical protein
MVRSSTAGNSLPLRDEPNRHQVPVRHWRRWSPGGHRMFNALYESMRDNPHLFRPPSSPVIPSDDWHVTAWNAAWMAADYYEGFKDG